MIKPTYAHICIPHTHHDFFTYETTGHEVCLGARVWVPFGQKNGRKMGIVTAKEALPPPGVSLKAIEGVLDEAPLLPQPILSLCQWVSQYYHAPLSEVLPLALPKNMRLAKALKPAVLPETNHFCAVSPPTLNPEQLTAITAITAHLDAFRCFLLEGVTGSGKTEVYLQVIDTVLQSQKQALVLVPEIGLTPQLLARFTTRFNVPIVVLHSNLSDGARSKAWTLARSGQARIVIGTRAAVFTVMPELGVIIIDEEHDAAFKQLDKVRYSARDTALVRAQKAGIPIVLGSATPSLESLYNVAKEKYRPLFLKKRAMTESPLRYQLIDIRNQFLEEGIAAPTRDCIHTHLEAGNQVLIFINRRGFAPVLLCRHCSRIVDCKHCDAHLTVHQKRGKLVCHHCGHMATVPTHCHCGLPGLVAVGSGTQRIEAILSTYFPAVPLLRIDRDEVQQRDALENHLQRIESGEVKLIVGTQMLAKGHHFPQLTLVVILDADYGFFHPDYRATERLGQLLTQVAGRAGRAQFPGHVLIQTHVPDHPLLQLLIQKGYSAFAKALLETRLKARLPPGYYVALLSAQAKNEARVHAFLLQAKNLIKVHLSEVFGPAPAPLARKGGYFRMQLFIKSASRAQLQTTLKSVREAIVAKRLAGHIHWMIDVDPQDLA